MTSLQVAGLATLGVFVLLLWIAALILHRTVWKWCPKCHCYHSHLGIMTKGEIPKHGNIARKAALCEVCK
jgi:hypothetical protein